MSWLARALVLSVMVVTQLLGRASASGSPAGWIEGFEGEREQYVIRRGGQRLTAAIFMPLLEGDQISVRGQTGRLRVAVGDGSSATEIRPGSPPYTVRSARVPTLPTNLMRWAAGWFTQWNQTRQGPVVGVHVRSGRPILLPPFEGAPGRLEAGTRSLFLTWMGGKAPYRVTLGREGPDVPLLFLTGVGESQVHVRNIALSPGIHFLAVEDAAGGQDRVPVTVVPTDQVPAVPDELMRSELPAAVRTTLFAAWLASRDEGVWIFEAYQQASMVATPDSPAALLRDALERGERPTGPGE